MSDTTYKNFEYISGTNLPANSLCLGTANLGLKQSVQEAFELLDTFVELGGKLIDTARIYSDWIPGEIGRSERIIGDWIRSRGHSTSGVTVTTKGCHFELANSDCSRVNPKAAKADIVSSLSTLGLDSLPLWVLHRDRPEIPVEEIVDFLQPFVEQGLVQHLGVSNWEPQRVARANEYAIANGRSPFVVCQNEFSLGSWAMSKRPEDKSMIATSPQAWSMHKKSKLCLMPYSALAKGFFTKAIESKNSSVVTQSPYYSAKNLRVASVVENICKQRGCNANAVALAYLRAQPFPVIPTVGAHSREQLEDCFAGIERSLNATEVSELNAASGWQADEGA